MFQIVAHCNTKLGQQSRAGGQRHMLMHLTTQYTELVTGKIMTEHLLVNP